MVMYNGQFHKPFLQSLQISTNVIPTGIFQSKHDVSPIATVQGVAN